MAPPAVWMPVQAEPVHARDMRGIPAAGSGIHRMGVVGCDPSSVGELVIIVEVYLDIDYQFVGVGEGDKRGEGSEGGLEMHGKAKSGSVRGGGWMNSVLDRVNTYNVGAGRDAYGNVLFVLGLVYCVRPGLWRFWWREMLGVLCPPSRLLFLPEVLN